MPYSNRLLQLSFIFPFFLCCALRPDFRYTNIERDRPEAMEEAEKTHQPKASALPLQTDSYFLDDSMLDNFKAQVRLYWQAPYQWGGTSPNGVDCSGLVFMIYKNGLGKTIPRHTLELFENGKPIAKNELQITDLVFFALQSKTNVDHVGIYIAKGFFLHASVSQGVSLSHLNDPPYKNSYIGARRYLY